MTRDQVQAQSLVRIKRMSVLMIIGYAIIVAAAVLGITVLSVTKYDELTKDKVSTMTSTLNVQLRLNLDSYLSRMEKIGTLAYSVDNAYSYDAADPKNDEYEAINIEKQISDDLKALCLMENFVDYGIVYSNNRTVGKISNGTVKLFGDALYADLSSMVSRARTHDGWSTGYHDDYERIYYVKQMNDNALLVISFYTAELEEVFDNPESLDDMAVRLTDKSYKMIYSSYPGDVPGEMIPSEILSDVEGKEMAAISGEKNLSTVNNTNGDWYIICSVPTDIILKDAADMKRSIYFAAFLAALIAIIAGAVFVKRMADPIGTVTGSLSDEISEDGYENVLGSRFFRDKAANLITSEKKDFGIILASIDNYGKALSECGREFADAQTARMAVLLKNVFEGAECIGRISENTFAVLMKNSDTETDSFRSLVVSRGVDICDMFKKDEKTSAGKAFEVTASVGASVGKNEFQKIYDSAYLALCASIENGKSRFTVL